MSADLPDFRVSRDAIVKAWGDPTNERGRKLSWAGSGKYAEDWRTYDDEKRLWYDRATKRAGKTVLDLARFEQGKPPLAKGERLRGEEFIAAWQYAFDQRWIDKPPSPKGNGKGDWPPIRATYPYQDENRAVLFEVVRCDTNDPDKRFRQRQPDGNGGWVWSIKGVRRVLFRLPETIAMVKAGERLLICEGERDANTAVKLGYAATTAPEGINKWRKEYDEFLRGADLVIVSDNDQQATDPKTGKPQFHPDGRPVLPGQDYAAKLTRRLSRVASRVRMIIPPVKDLSEWIAAGSTREALDELIDAAPDQVKQPPSPEPEEPPEEEREDQRAELLAELNRDNCVVLDGARTRVLRFERVEYDADGERYVYEVPTFLRFDDFKNFYLNRRIRISDDKTMPLGAWWLAQSRRRQYDGLVFEPRSPTIVRGKLNLWRGWGVEPKQGDWSLMRRHIKQVLCADDEDVDTYSVNWLAWSVQNPDKPPEVAIVFIGERGTGKGTLGKAMCRIFGQHACHITSADHLTGHFNAHLRQCSFLFGDEAYAPKDKGAESVLKAMITEPTLPIEPKGRDRIEVPNCLHLMLAGNNDWVIPAGMHERRFVVQKVSNSKRQDRTWFGPLYQQLANDGYGAMLYDLLRRDLGDWHPREIVRTAALAEQQIQSLSPLDEWWLEILHTGVLVGSRIGEPDRAVSTRYEEEISESDAYGGKRVRIRRREGLFDSARASSPRLRGISDHAIGHYLSNKKGANRAWVQRRRGWEFPPLAQCRDEWCTSYPDTEWRDEGITDWRAEAED
jgi:hypothetical protein